MKVTAFIRKTAAKNNITDQARVYFRVRDIGGVDIKAASELSINPNHWSPERQGYKPRVALVSEEKKMNFDKDVQQITHLITKEYHRGVDGSWLKSLIEEYHHPGINARGGNKADEYLLSYQIRKYVEETPLADESRKHHLDNLNKVLRYERFRHEVLHQRGFHLCIDTVTADDIRDFKLWMQEEHKYVDMYPVFYRNEVRRNVEQKRSENSMSGSLYRIRTVIKWCVKRGLTRNNPFDQYQIARPMYGDPFYLTLEERDKVYYADKCRRYIDELAIPEKDAQLLTKYRKISEYFDKACEGVKSPKTVSNFIIGQIFRRTETEADKEIFDVAVTPEQLNELVKLLDSGKIRNNLAKATLEKMLDSGKGALEFISESDMGGLDENALNDLCKQAVEGNPKAVEDYKNGKEKAIKSLVGNVMKNSRGKADPALAESKIKELIG